MPLVIDEIVKMFTTCFKYTFRVITWQMRLMVDEIVKMFFPVTVPNLFKWNRDILAFRFTSEKSRDRCLKKVLSRLIRDVWSPYHIIKLFTA